MQEGVDTPVIGLNAAFEFEDCAGCGHGRDDDGVANVVGSALTTAGGLIGCCRQSRTNPEAAGVQFRRP